MESFIEYTRSNPGTILAVCAALIILVIYMYLNGSSMSVKRRKGGRQKKRDGPESNEIDSDMEEEIDDILKKFN